MFKKILILPAALVAFACGGNDKKVDDALNSDLSTADSSIELAEKHDERSADDRSQDHDHPAQLVGRHVLLGAGLQRSGSAAGSQAHQA